MVTGTSAASSARSGASSVIMPAPSSTLRSPNTAWRRSCQRACRSASLSSARTEPIVARAAKPAIKTIRLITYPPGLLPLEFLERHRHVTPVVIVEQLPFAALTEADLHNGCFDVAALGEQRADLGRERIEIALLVRRRRRP